MFNQDNTQKNYEGLPFYGDTEVYKNETRLKILFNGPDGGMRIPIPKDLSSLTSLGKTTLLQIFKSATFIGGYYDREEQADAAKKLLLTFVDTFSKYISLKGDIQIEEDTAPSGKKQFRVSILFEVPTELEGIEDLAAFLQS